MPGTVNRYMMPASNVGHLSLTDKCRATQLAGFQSLSLTPLELETLLEQGASLAQIRRTAANFGVQIERLDSLISWSRIWHSDDSTMPITPARFMVLSERLGCSHLSLSATFGANAMARDEVVEQFAAVCALAAEHGLVCDLEFVPHSGIASLVQAWDIVRDAGATNGGLVFDAWHFVRDGADILSLKDIPGERIHCVQLNDGRLRLPAEVSITHGFQEPTSTADGEFPLTALIKALVSIGGLGQVSPEVFSLVLGEMTVEQVAARSVETVTRVLGAAGVLPC